MTSWITGERVPYMERPIIARGRGRGGFGPRFPMRRRMWRRGYMRGPFRPWWRWRMGCPCGCLTLALIGVVISAAALLQFVL